jgi:GNAT superfamily N-acetyltransferase
MKMERLSQSNLRQAIYCCQERGAAGEQQLQAFGQWIDEGRLYGQVAREGPLVAGFVIYFPIERAPVEIEGQDLLAIQCMWVRPEMRGRGVGRGLIDQVCDDARRAGRKGIAMEGFTFPAESASAAFMPRDYFVSLGFRQLDHHWNNALLFLPLAEGAEPPAYSTNVFAPPAGRERLRIDMLNCDKCVAGLLNTELVCRLLPLYADRVEVFEYDQNLRENVLLRGRHFGIFFDGQLELHGGPTTEEKVRGIFERHLAERRGRAAQDAG